MDSKSTTSTTQFIDGIMSGSTFSKIAYIVVAGGVVAAIIAAIVKILAKD